MWGCYYLIEFIDHISGEGQQGRYKLTKEDGTTENVILNLDDGAEVEGTPINRENLMAMQGFVATHTDPPTTNELGEEQIIQTNTETNEQLVTTFKLNGQIEDKFIGTKTIIKTTTFNSDGSISEVIS